jgi:hypothetical protein
VSARIEFRCPHGFMRSVVRCPHGCAPVTAVPLTRDGNIRRRPPVPQRRPAPERRPKWHHVGDARIVEVLECSCSAAEAARELGTSQPNLYLYAQSRPAVWPAYQATAKRGLENRGARGRARGRACGFRGP